MPCWSRCRAGVVTATGPVVAPVGTVAVIWVPEVTVNVAAVPLKVTAVAPVKPLPVMLTDVPGAPEVGVNEETAGAAVTVNDAVLVPVPAGVVTATGPVVAPVGTVAVIWVPEVTVNVAAVPLKVTAVAPVKPLPVMLTDVPGAPEVGVNEETTGPEPVTVNDAVLVPVPAGVVTATGPVVAPVGTVAVIWVPEVTVNVAAVPLKVTAVAPVKPLPVMLTDVPGAPEVGVNEETAGAAVTVNDAVLVPVPAGVVTATGPVVAPVGTVAVIWVPEVTVNVAAVPLKVTAVAPVKPLPVMLTDVPGAPEVGVNEETAGAAVTVNDAVLVPVPAGVVTATGPVVAPVGTVAVIWVPEVTVNVAAVPLKVTAVAPVKPLPVMLTDVPGAPEVGVNEETTGPEPPPPPAIVAV